jgi:hypothetical protein
MNSKLILLSQIQIDLHRKVSTMKIFLFALSILSPLALSAQQKNLRLSRGEIEHRKVVLLRDLAAFQHRHLAAHHNKVTDQRRKLILQQQHHHYSQSLDHRELRVGHHDAHAHGGLMSRGDALNYSVGYLDATNATGLLEFNDTIGKLFPCPQDKELNRLGLDPSKFEPCVIGGLDTDPINGSTWVAPCPSAKESEFFNITEGDYDACDSNTTMPFDPIWYNDTTNFLFPCPSEKELTFFNLNLTDFEPCDPNITLPFEPYTPPCPSEQELAYFNTTMDLYEPCNPNETMPFDPSWFNGSNWWVPPCPSKEELAYFNTTMDLYEPCNPNETMPFDPNWFDGSIWWLPPCPSKEEFDLFNFTLTDFGPCDPNATFVPISPCPFDDSGPCDPNTTIVVPFEDAPSIWLGGSHDDSNSTISWMPGAGDNSTVGKPCPSEDELASMGLTAEQYGCGVLTPGEDIDYNATFAVASSGHNIPCPPAEFLASIGMTAEEFGCKDPLD